MRFAGARFEHTKRIFASIGGRVRSDRTKIEFMIAHRHRSVAKFIHHFGYHRALTQIRHQGSLQRIATVEQNNPTGVVFTQRFEVAAKQRRTPAPYLGGPIAVEGQSLFYRFDVTMHVGGADKHQTYFVSTAERRRGEQQQSDAKLHPPSVCDLWQEFLRVRLRCGVYHTQSFDQWIA